MNLPVRLCAVLFAAVLTTSCATHYGPNTLFGGYKETRIDDARFRVKFDGNGYASQERVWSFWIYRCAELTKQNGYAFFGLESPPMQTSSISGPGPIRNVAYQPADGPHFVRTAGGVSYVPIYIPGGRVTTWHTDAVVVMFKEPPSNGTPVLRAQSVLDELDASVKSNGATVPVSRDEVLSHAAVIHPRTGDGRPGTLPASGRYRYVGSIGRDQFVVDVESIRRDGDIVRYRLRSSNSDAAYPVDYEGLIGVDCQKRTRMEFEHAVSLNRGPVRRGALVPEPKTVFPGTRQELELNAVCELARDLT
jgi:hypothetical protein